MPHLFTPAQRMAEPNPFLPPFFPPEISLFWGNSIWRPCHHLLWDSRGTSDACGEEVFNWVISSDLLPLNDRDTPRLLHRSSGSRSSPDIFFAPSSLALSCSWEVLQDLGSDHLLILLSVPLSPVFRPNERPLSFNFRGYLSELHRVTCSKESHSSFCSPFSLAEFLAAASNLSSSTATGPDKVAYPMLKHLPRSGMDFLLHIFNLFWSSHSFTSIWKTSSIIPIHKMGKPLDSPASFWPISLTSCVSKLFERIILSRLLFFLESNSILSPRQVGFRPGRSTLDQILYLSQSISDGFNKPRPGSRTILSTIDFSKAFDTVWHPAHIHKLISAGLPPCFARWTQSFLSDRRASVVFQNHKSRSFRVRRGVPQRSVLGPVLFSLFINDLPASLPSSVSCSLYADNLAIWSSSHSVPTAVEATQGALFRLERWSEYWCLPLNPSKCEVSFFSVDPHQANLQSNLFLLGSPSVSIPLRLFLGSPSTALFPFLSMYLR